MEVSANPREVDGPVPVLGELMHQHFRTVKVTVWVLMIINGGLGYVFYRRYGDPLIAWWSVAAASIGLVRGGIAWAYLRRAWRLSPQAWERWVFYPSFPLLATYPVGAWILFREGDAAYNILFAIWFMALSYATMAQAPSARIIAVAGAMAGGSVVIRLATENSVGYRSAALLLGCMTLGAILVGARTNRIRREGLAQSRASAEMAVRFQRQMETLIRNSIDKTRLLSTASHDLRQPLHAASLLALSLKARLAANPEVEQHVEKLQASLDSLNDALHALLDLSQLDERMRTKPGNVLVPEVFADLLIQFRTRAQSKGISLRFHSRPAAQAWTDRHLLARLLGNVLDNAIKYTFTGGVLVTTRHCPDPDLLVIEVRDSGIGIDPAHHDLIFDEFFRAADGGAHLEGRGLGLAIVRRVCEILGMQWQVRSSPGRGSVFRFSCPVSPEALNEARRRSASLAQLSE